MRLVKMKWLGVLLGMALLAAGCSPGAGIGPQSNEQPGELAAPEARATALTQAEAGGGQNPENYRIPPSPTLPAVADQEPLPLPQAGTPGVPPKLQFLIERAQADMVERLQIDPQTIEFVEMTAQPGELVCPEIQTIAPPQPAERNHTLLRLQAGGEQFTYLVEGLAVKLCDRK